jgi:pimeloyl-ACP methyl ester carboxylesterase
VRLLSIEKLVPIGISYGGVVVDQLLTIVPDRITGAVFDSAVSAERGGGSHVAGYQMNQAKEKFFSEQSAVNRETYSTIVKMVESKAVVSRRDGRRVSIADLAGATIWSSRQRAGSTRLANGLNTLLRNSDGSALLESPILITAAAGTADTTALQISLTPYYAPTTPKDR